jgi:hypothetical protein
VRIDFQLVRKLLSGLIILNKEKSMQLTLSIVASLSFPRGSLSAF